MVDRNEPVSPLCFRDFRLHRVYTQPPAGGLIHHITLPHLQGEVNSNLVEYDVERFPLNLVQSLKIVINLQPPASDHWSITLDQIFPTRLKESWQEREAKRLAHAQQEGSKEAEASHTEETTKREPPPEPETGDSDRVFPTKAAPSREQVMKTNREFMEHVHALHL